MAAWRSRVRVTRRRSRPQTSRSPSGSAGSGPAGLVAGRCLRQPRPGRSAGAVVVVLGLFLRQARCATTVFSAYSARLCHRCQRSATWIASGAPSRAPSA